MSNFWSCGVPTLSLLSEVFFQPLMASVYTSYRMHIQSVYAEVKGRQVHALKHLC